MEKVRTFVRNLFTFVSNHRELALGLAVIASMCVVSIVLYANHKKTAEEIPVITTVYSASDDKLTPYAVLDAAKANGKTISNNRQVSNNDANDITRLANRSASTEKPYAHSITTDEAVADNKAKEIAKNRKADMVIKQTAEDKQASNDKIQVHDNNYYVINQERKHAINVGVADVDNSAYATVSYRNRQVEYTAMYNPSTHQAGAMVQVTVSKW